MDKELKYVIGSFSILAATIIAYSIINISSILNAKPSRGIKTATVSYLKDPIDINKIQLHLRYKYVYDNSTICENAAKLIVGQTFREEHALLLLAIFRQESSYKANRTGTKTKYGYARGLGQVMWSIWKSDLRMLGIYNPRELYDPVKNVRASSYIVSYLSMQKNGNVADILTGYYGARDRRYITKITTYLTELQILTHVALEIVKTQHDRGVYGYDLH